MKILPSKRDVLIIAGIVIAIGLGYGGSRYWKLHLLNSTLRGEAAGLRQSLSITDKNLSLTQKGNADLTEALVNEQSKNNLFEAQIRDISGVVGDLSGTVGVLQKLSQTDPELLKKYSKVYFLSENYVPSHLAPIDTQYLYQKNKPEQLHVSAWPFLERMLDSAGRDNITLQVVSAYRSFGAQVSVKSGYKVVYGAGTANQFSAEQGYSEHQLGTTVDFTTLEIKAVFAGFEKTQAYQWLEANAYRFGFVLSYPANNSYYQFEPWHWRFVGVTLATKLRDEGKYLYELSQREIDAYLVNIFD